MLLLLALACSGGDPATPDDTGLPEGDPGPEWFDPSARGPYEVGSAAVTITGSTGVELEVQIWYPTDAAGDELHLYGGLVSGGAWDEPEASCAMSRPVLSFSHGNGGLRFQSYFFTEHLASHGWVVVAPDHTDNTAFDYDDDALAEVMLRRPGDLRDAYDLLLTDANPAVDCMDEALGYAVSGHSFGGYTSMAAAGAVLDVEASAAFCADKGNYWLCSELADQAEAQGQTSFDLSDDRVWAAVPMAPAGLEVLAGGLPLVTAPTLVWGGSRDELTSMRSAVTPIYEALTVSPRYLGEVADAGHYSFSNACELLGSYDDCDPPYLAPAEVHAIVNTVSTAFLGEARGIEEASAWLPGDQASLSWTAN